MGTAAFWALGDVSDEQLRRALKLLLAGSARTEARIIAHIAEVEARQLHLRDGSPSAFEYCRAQLGLSESEAFHRLTAARIARKYPLVFAVIERREIYLSGVCLLRDYLTPGNHVELLAEAAHKTKLQVMELLARRFPRPDVKSRIRKLPTNAQVAKQPSISQRNDPAPNPAAQSAAHNSAPTALQAALSSPAMVVPAIPSRVLPAAAARPLIEPTSEARYRIQLNATASLKEKLELLRALMSHSVPSGDLALVVERAVEMALEQVQKQRFAKTDEPRSARTQVIRRSVGHREHVPNATQREVATRDGLRCTYVSDAGCRCTAQSFLQLHHEQPWARGGDSTPENLRLLCAAHNRMLADRDFGAAHVAQRRAARRPRTAAKSEPTADCGAGLQMAQFASIQPKHR